MKSIVWFVLSVFTFAPPVSAKPEISNMAVTGDTLGIHGSGFDQPCSKCEVIANFDNLRYALQIVSWADTDIKAKLVDLGKGTRPTIELVTPDWQSRPVRVKLNERFLPARRIERYISSKSKNDEIFYFSRRFDASIGGKGEEIFDVGQNLPACGNTALIFDSADILIGRLSRFGEAKVTRMPAPGCIDCKLKVVYYWEPTGRLDYQLHIYRRVVEGICKARIR